MQCRMWCNKDPSIHPSFYCTADRYDHIFNKNCTQKNILSASGPLEGQVDELLQMYCKTKETKHKIPLKGLLVQIFVALFKKKMTSPTWSYAAHSKP